MDILATNSTLFSSAKYSCNLCDYMTSRYSQYARHLATRKHLNFEIGNRPVQLVLDNSANEFMCGMCDKKYKDRSGLWKHNKKCAPPQKKPLPLSKPSSLFNKDEPHLMEFLMKENSDFKNVILELVKSNSDLQKQMMEVCKKGNTIINSNNGNNKTFNMQIFLNEQCKDAMNIMDFVDTFKLEFSDLERVGEVGYVEGISGIIIQKLNKVFLLF